ncbi:MAG: gamma carbonic anhydrase family protein [Syntrophomonadaceae bacterium]|nr:gamma carbonic anhydrase family protein [Syntrophomonadaceae bacterium]
MAIYEFEGHRPQIDPTAFIHPDATVIGAVTIGPECFVGAGAVIRGDYGTIAIGSRSNVQENAVLHAAPGTDMIIGNGVLIGHGAIMHGLTLADGALVGMGAIVSHECHLEADAMLGAGSLLPPRKTLHRRMLAVGSPAKEIRELDDKAVKSNEMGIVLYSGLAARYHQSLRRIDS